MKSILVLTDFSKRAEHAAQFALEIAATTGYKILLYNAFYVPQAVPMESGVYPYYEEFQDLQQEGHLEMEALAKKINRKFTEMHHSSPPEIRILNEPGKLGENIRNLTIKENIWLIVMGDKSKEGAASRFIFGSHSHDVIDHALCPVLLIPAKADPAHLRRMVFASDLDHSEHHAALFVEKLAQMWQSEITVLHVCENTLTVEEKAKNYTDFKKIISGIKYPVNYVDIRGEDITATISTYAGREKIDLIAIVHKKRSFIGSLLHKSISKKMINYHKVPILILQSHHSPNHGHKRI